jgi:hypothetical protein
VFRTTLAVVLLVLVISLGLGFAIGGKMGSGGPRPAAPVPSASVVPAISPTVETGPSWYVPSTLSATPSPAGP